MSRLSPFQRRLAEKQAAKAIKNAPAANIAVARPVEADTAPYSLLRLQMGQHLAELKALKSIDAKIAHKAEILSVYNDHIDTVILTADAEDKAVQDEVFVQVMIWTLDAASVKPELYPRAFELADHVIRFKLDMPERFNRSAAEYVLEAVVEDAEKKLKTADAANLRPFEIDTLTRAENLTTGHDMVDQIPAKLNKVIGKLFVLLAQAIDKGEVEAPAGGAKGARAVALRRFKRAVELNDKIGVTKDIEQLERALKNEPSPAV